MGGRIRAAMQRLLDLSLVALAVGTGTVGYYWNANEDEATRMQRIRDERVLAQRRRYEQILLRLAKHYDSRIKEVSLQRDHLIKLRGDTEALSHKVSQHRNEEAKKLQMLSKHWDELRQRASDTELQKQTLDAEVKELVKLLKMKEGPEAGSENHELLLVEVQEVEGENKVLQDEIEELLRLVKVKVELQSKAKTLNVPSLSNQSRPTMQKDDPVQS